MSEDELEKIRDELSNAEITEFNRNAVIELMEEWSMNIGENIPLARQARDLQDFHRENKPNRVVVCGAAPSLSDEQIVALREFKGHIIVTNKNYQRFCRLGVIPEWVVLLDAHPVSAMQFEFLEKYPWPEEDRGSYLVETKFFVSTTVYPQSLKYIMEFAGADHVYMFNPIHDDGTAVRLSKTWSWMNERTEFEHGGSVGNCAINLAKHLSYKHIALLGFDLCENPLEVGHNWTIEETQQRDFKYYPDTNEVIAIPTHFKAYMAYIFAEIVDTPWANWYNLGTSPALRHSPYLIQMTVKEYVRRSRKVR